MTNREFYNVILNGTANVSYKNEAGNTEYKNITIDAPEVKEFAEAALAKLNARNKARQEKLAPEKAEKLALRTRVANETEVGTVYTGAALAEMFGVPQAKLNYQIVQLANAGYFEKAKVRVTKGKGKVNAYTRTAKVYDPEAEIDEAPDAE